MDQVADVSHHEPDGGLATRSFMGLLITQFLGAFNDNIFRWLVVGIGKALVTPERHSFVLTLGSICFVIPFVLFATHAGYLADRFSKRNVIVGCKVAEVVIMLLGVAAIFINSIEGLLLVLFLMGTQSALFGPSKLGSIPEIVRYERLSTANGLIALTTVVAIVVGTATANVLYSMIREEVTWLPASIVGVAQTLDMWLPSMVIVGVALCGLAASLMIGPLPVSNPTQRLPRQPFENTARDFKLLFSSRPLFRVALGVCFFWSLAALAQLNIDQLLTQQRAGTQASAGLAAAILASGVGLGSIIAGLLSGGRVELGLVPLGAMSIAVSSVVLWTVAEGEFVWLCFWLFALGFGAGFFDIPLQTFIQHRSPKNRLGAVLSASNFLTFSGIILASGVFFVLRTPLGLEPSEVFLVCGLATLPVVVYSMVVLPYATIRFLVWLLSHTIYRVRVFDRENLPEDGGALLVANHVSWIDGVLLLLSSSRPIRMLAYADYVEPWPVRWLARLAGVIPIKPEKPRQMIEALRIANQAVRDGELVCIFPEGQLTRTGQMQPFHRGMMKILDGNDVPVVPVYLDELWGSIFSYRGGRFLWKRPRQWPYHVSILFGKPIPHPDNVHQVRQAVQILGAQAVEKRKSRSLPLSRLFVRRCRKYLRHHKVSDSMGQTMTGGSLLMRTVILARLLRKHVLARDEQMVGVLLPPSAGGVLANAALPLLRRVAVNLNYTASNEVLNNCIAQCNIKHVLTSRRVMDKLDVKLDAELVYLEDFKDKVTTSDKISGVLRSYVLPAFITERLYGLHRVKPDDVLTVIFTSGSTGDPKGVLLTYHNVGSNIASMDQLVSLTRDDVVMGMLPFFHSFGYTITLWTVLALDPQGVYHFTPLDPRQIGKLVAKYGCNLMMATPTFLRSYLKRCEPEQLASLEMVLAGAEKLPPDLCDAFEAKFGMRPLEGYGATELSPLLAVNVPDHRSVVFQKASKPGTVGRPIPGTSVKIVDPEDYQRELGTGEVGMMLAQGPNIMLGYLNKPAETAEKMVDGWYITGDLALVDEEGFIQITGRESRFSKLAGEMVPHIKIEETIAAFLGDEEELRAVVTAVPDERKGERLVVIHTAIDKSPDDICTALKDAGLPNLWIPSTDSFMQVEEIPVLGTGKLALSQIRDLALERFGGPNRQT